jgi:hypothetical protein
MVSPDPRRWAARVTQENGPKSNGVVRVMAGSDHWRWVSTPESSGLRVWWSATSGRPNAGQDTGFDQMAVARSHGIPIDAPGPNPGFPMAF